MGFADDLFGGGGSEGGFEQIPLTPEQQQAEDFLVGLLGDVPDIPTRGITGLTDLERESQERLADFSRLGEPETLTKAIDSLNNLLSASPDVRETPGFQAFLEESERLRGLGQSNIARQGQGRTGGFSLPTARQSAEFDEGVNRNILGELGRRQELNRQFQLQAIPQALNVASAQRAFPLQQLGAVQQLGALPRQIGQLGQDALFNQQLQTVLFPFQSQAPIASNILGRDAFAFQQGTPDSEGSIGDIASLIGKFGSAGGTGTGGFGGGGQQSGGDGGFLGDFGTGSDAGDVQMAMQIAALFSDERLKEDIVEIDNALEKVEELTGYTYHYKFKDNEDDKNGGVMAQDLEKVLPDAVYKTDSGFSAVKYDAVIGLLVNAVKELSSKVNELESKEL